jgi:hypothetical protein
MNHQPITHLLTETATRRRILFAAHRVTTHLLRSVTASQKFPFSYGQFKRMLEPRESTDTGKVAYRTF